MISVPVNFAHYLNYYEFHHEKRFAYYTSIEMDLIELSIGLFQNFEKHEIIAWNTEQMLKVFYFFKIVVLSTCHGITNHKIVQFFVSVIEVLKSISRKT